MKKLLISLFTLLIVFSPIATAQGVSQNSKEFWSDSYVDATKAYRGVRNQILEVQFEIVKELSSNTWTGESNEFNNMWNASTSVEDRENYIQNVIIKVLNEQFEGNISKPSNRGQSATEKDLARKDYVKYLKDTMGLEENDSSFTSALSNWDSMPWKGSTPTIVLNGGGTVQLILGDEWVDPSAIAEDPVDGSLTIVVSGDTVDTNTAGTYNITYTATDSGGQSVSVTRRVIVIPVPTPPQP